MICSSNLGKLAIKLRGPVVFFVGKILSTDKILIIGWVVIKLLKNQLELLHKSVRTDPVPK